MSTFLRTYIPAKGSFLSNAITLLTGTTFAQIFVIASAPILSRLYSPEDFGITAVFISISSLIALVACGRYETAIMLPKEDEDASNIWALAIAISLGVSLLFLLVVALFRQQIANLLHNPKLAGWFWLIPITIFMTGLYQACNFWSSRKKHFRRLATSRVSNSVATVGTQIGTGFVTHGGPLGLIAGQVAGWLVSAGILCGQILIDDFYFLAKNIKKENIYRQAKIYYRFPLIDVWSTLANFGAQKFPILIINNFFDATIVGYYFFGYRVLNFPLQFIGASVSQVFFQRYEEKRKTSGKKVFLLRAIKSLALIAIIPAILSFSFAPYLFKIIFGSNWITAGEYIRILTPILFFRLVVAPVMTVIWSEGKNIILLIWQISFFICSISSFLIGGYLKNIYYALILYSISSSLLYIILLFIVLKAGNNGNTN